MKQMLRGVIYLGALIMLSGCANLKLEHYSQTKPEMDIKAYFDGKIQAWGIVQDWRGKVVQRFDVVMQGSWEGDIGTLEEDFLFYDGKKQHRVWRIEKISQTSYQGTAGDIIGQAKGNQSGSAVRWRYEMDVPVGDTSYRLSFDDWMWQLNDGVLFNRSYMKKFGIKVAELTLFMKKVDSGVH